MTKNHEILPSTRDEDLLHCSVSKKSNVPSWNTEEYLTPFMKPQKFPTYPPSLESNADFPTTTQEEPHFPLLSSRRGSISLLCLERNGEVPVIPQEEASLNLNLERSLGVLPQFERHRFPHPLNKPDSPAPIRMEPRESTHNMKGGLRPRLQIQEKSQKPN